MKMTVLLTALLTMMGCVNLHGKLIATDGANEIYQIDLRYPEEKTTIYKTRGIIGKISKVNNRTFIFDEFEWRKDPVIRQYNLDSGEVKTLGQGFEPTYLAGRNQIVFYRQIPGTDRIHGGIFPNWDCWMVAADVGNLERFIRIMSIKGHKPPVIQISPDEILFRVDHHVWIYNLLKSKDRGSNASEGFKPVLWREKTKEMLYDRGDFGFLLAPGYRSEKRCLWRLGGARDAVYIPDDDAMIYVKTAWEEPGDTYWYSFQYSWRTKIRTGGHRSAIWIP